MIAVSKYHGCGNDFIIMLEEDVLEMNKERLAIAICDRNTGIGADGFIIVHKDPLEMEIYNCDGSQAPMCGNGIRCFAKFCLDEKLVKTYDFDVATLAGIKKVHVEHMDPFMVEIEMGKADDDPRMIHTSDGLHVFDMALTIANGTFLINSFFMSTIHTIIFVDHAFADKWDEIGKAICHHPFFEEQTNVNFVEVVNSHTIAMCTYERGVGMTLACGTGACAAVRCAYKKGLTGSNVHVDLVKGSLEINIDANENITMCGPAKRVMKGVYEHD